MSYAAALAFATEAHKGQVRRGLVESYIRHPERVAALAVEIGLPEDAVAAAVLHDVIEDCKVRPSALDAVASPRTVQLVVTLSKWWSSNTDLALKAVHRKTYYDGIAADPEALLLKFLDRTDNLRDGVRALHANPRDWKLKDWLARYVVKTVDEFSPLLAPLDRTGHPARAKVLHWFTDALSKLQVVAGEPTSGNKNGLTLV